MIPRLPVSYAADKVRKYPAKKNRIPTRVARVVLEKSAEIAMMKTTIARNPSSQKTKRMIGSAFGYKLAVAMVMKIPDRKKNP